MKRFVRFVVGFFLVGALVGTGVFVWLLGDLPEPAALEERLVLPSVRIVDRTRP